MIIIPRNEPATKAVFSEATAGGKGSHGLGTASDEGWGSWNLGKALLEGLCFGLGSRRAELGELKVNGKSLSVTAAHPSATNYRF